MTRGKYLWNKFKIAQDYIRRGKMLLKILDENTLIDNIKSDDKMALSFFILDKKPEFRTLNDIKILSRCTDEVKFFKDLRLTSEGIQIHELCCKYMERISFDENKIIFNEEDPPQFFYLILIGKVKIFKKNIIIHENGLHQEIQQDCIELNNGQFFGEKALENDSPRTASAITLEYSQFCVLDKKFYNKILKDYNKNILLEQFGHIKIFEGWQTQHIKHIYDLSIESNYQYGNYIYREGDEPMFIYLIKSGEFSVIQNIDQEENKIEKNNEQCQNESIILNNEDNQNENQKLGDQNKKNDQQIENNILKIQSKKNQVKIKKNIKYLNIFTQNEWFGEEELFTKQQRQFTVMCSSTKGILYQIHKYDFLKRILHDEKILQNIKNQIQVRQNFRDQIQKPVKNKYDKDFFFAKKDKPVKRVINFDLFNEQTIENISSKNFFDNQQKSQSLYKIEEVFTNFENYRRNLLKNNLLNNAQKENIVLQDLKKHAICQNANYILKFENDVMKQFYDKYNLPNESLVTRKKTQRGIYNRIIYNKESLEKQMSCHNLNSPKSFLIKTKQKLDIIKTTTHYKKIISQFDGEQNNIIKTLNTEANSLSNQQSLNENKQINNSPHRRIVTELNDQFKQSKYFSKNSNKKNSYKQDQLNSKQSLGNKQIYIDNKIFNGIQEFSHASSKKITPQSLNNNIKQINQLFQNNICSARFTDTSNDQYNLSLINNNSMLPLKYRAKEIENDIKRGQLCKIQPHHKKSKTISQLKKLKSNLQINNNS